MATPENSTNNYYPQEIRRVKKINTNRINDDWAYLEEPEAPVHPTTDQKFNLTYKSNGINSTSISKPEKVNTGNNGANGETVTKYRFRVNTKQKNKEGSDGFKAIIKNKKNKAFQARATRVNASILSWVIWSYPAQLVFALLGLIVLSLASGTEGVANSNLIFKTVADVANSVIKFVTGFGVSDAMFGMYMVTYVVVLALGIITLISIYLQYTLSLLKPFSGEKSGLKLGIFLLAIAGYSLPIANLFPWAILFMAVVWKYPR